MKAMDSQTKKERILLVDDSPSTLEVLERNLASQGFSILTAGSVAQAIQILDANAIDLVITDLRMPGASGVDLVRHVRENFKETEIMIITGYPTVQSAVAAVKTGAEDYLAKPFTDAELFSSVQRILETLRRKKAGSRPPVQKMPAAYGLLGESPAIIQVGNMIAKAAMTSATVLITGESGTGKELVSRAIHYTSPRASAPFVPVNCGAIPEELIESELFGHVKGAFTSATETRAGFFQTADGGTIFLDEVSEMSLATQVKLLRVLQDKEICMVGSSRPRKVDVRILASTNKDLLGLVRKGVFREDLFFRVNVITIDLPPLRERGNDIQLLISHFSKKFADEMGKKAPVFSPRALQALQDYHWPGNVRELENVIQRMIVLMDDDVVDVPDLPPLMRFSASREGDLGRTLAEVEAGYIRNVLASVDGNRTRASEILGIDRKTLRKKLHNTTGPEEANT
jgi:DNA-binding NtrC family response regulator